MSGNSQQQRPRLSFYHELQCQGIIEQKKLGCSTLFWNLSLLSKWSVMAPMGGLGRSREHLRFPGGGVCAGACELPLCFSRAALHPLPPTAFPFLQPEFSRQAAKMVRQARAARLGELPPKHHPKRALPAAFPPCMSLPFLCVCSLSPMPVSMLCASRLRSKPATGRACWSIGQPRTTADGRWLLEGRAVGYS